MVSLLSALLLASCVVRYDGGALAPAQPLPPPADFTEVEQRLGELLRDAQESDSIDRLQAANELASDSRHLSPDAQQVALGYLRQVVSIEERAREVKAPSLYVDDPGQSVAPMAGFVIQEEDLDVPLVVAPVTPPAAPEPVAPEPVVAEPADPAEPVVPATEPAALRLQAEAAMLAGDSWGALTLLETCRDKGCWLDVVDVWAEARDAYVFEVREQAGKLYLQARNESDAQARLGLLLEVRQTLADLLDRYPANRYATALRRNVDLVQRELEAARAE